MTQNGRISRGKRQLNAHMYRLNLVSSPDCRRCGDPETVEHVLFDCPAYSSERVMYFDTLTTCLGYNYRPSLQSALGGLGNALTRIACTNTTLQYIRNTGLLSRL